MNESDLEELEARLYSQVYHSNEQFEAPNIILPQESPIAMKKPNRYFQNIQKNVPSKFHTRSEPQPNLKPPAAEISQSEGDGQGFFSKNWSRTQKRDVPATKAFLNQLKQLGKNPYSNDSNHKAKSQKKYSKWKAKVLERKKQRKIAKLLQAPTKKPKSLEIITVSDSDEGEADKSCVLIEKKWPLVFVTDSDNESPEKDKSSDDVIFVKAVSPTVEIINLEEDETVQVCPDAHAEVETSSVTSSTNSFINYTPSTPKSVNPHHERKELFGTPDSAGNDFITNTSQDLNPALNDKFVKPVNPAESYETETSSSTTDANNAIHSMKTAVFSEIEFPKDNLFSEANLESFGNFITPLRNREVKEPEKSSTPVAKNKADPTSDSSSESDYEDPAAENRKTTKHLPDLSPMHSEASSPSNRKLKKSRTVLNLCSKYDLINTGSTELEAKQAKLKKNKSSLLTEALSLSPDVNLESKRKRRRKKKSQTAADSQSENQSENQAEDQPEDQGSARKKTRARKKKADNTFKKKLDKTVKLIKKRLDQLGLDGSNTELEPFAAQKSGPEIPSLASEETVEIRKRKSNHLTQETADSSDNQSRRRSRAKKKRKSGTEPELDSTELASSILQKSISEQHEQENEDSVEDKKRKSSHLSEDTAENSDNQLRKRSRGKRKRNGAGPELEGNDTELESSLLQKSSCEQQELENNDSVDGKKKKSGQLSEETAENSDNQSKKKSRTRRKKSGADLNESEPESLAVQKSSSEDQELDDVAESSDNQSRKKSRAKKKRSSPEPEPDGKDTELESSVQKSSSEDPEVEDEHTADNKKRKTSQTSETTADNSENQQKKKQRAKKKSVESSEQETAATVRDNKESEENVYANAVATSSEGVSEEPDKDSVVVETTLEPQICTDNSSGLSPNDTEQTTRVDTTAEPKITETVSNSDGAVDESHASHSETANDENDTFDDLIIVDEVHETILVSDSESIVSSLEKNAMSNCEGSKIKNEKDPTSDVSKSGDPVLSDSESVLSALHGEGDIQVNVEGPNVEIRRSSNVYVNKANVSLVNDSVEDVQQTMTDDPEFWTISDRDRDPSKEKYTRRCKRCKEKGHLAFRCPNRVTPKCSLCGQSGHYEPRCHNRICTQCGVSSMYSTIFCKSCFHLKHYQCRICFVTGHDENSCPDLWRRYHLTTSEGPLTVSVSAPLKPRPELWCSGCATPGHLEHECRYYISPYPLSDPSIKIYEEVYAKTANYPVNLQQPVQSLMYVNPFAGNAQMAPLAPQPVNYGPSSSHGLNPFCFSQGNFYVDNVQNAFPQNNQYYFEDNLPNYISFDSPLFNVPQPPVQNRCFNNVRNVQTSSTRRIRSRTNELFFSTPAQSVQKFIQDELSKLATLACRSGQVAEELKQQQLQCIRGRAESDYQKLNMVLFGVFCLNDGRKHLTRLRSFKVQKLDERKFGQAGRHALSKSYWYIFGNEPHERVDYNKLLRRVTND